jgi:hypothetical protein
MKKGMRERVSSGDVCDCCFGEQLDNKKPFRPLYTENYGKYNTTIVVVLLLYHLYKYGFGLGLA